MAQSQYEAETRPEDRRDPRRADRRNGDRRDAGPASRGRRHDDSLFDTLGETGPDDESALLRVYRTYAAARAAIGVGLVLVQALGNLLGSRGSEWAAWVSLLYAAEAITLWLLPRFGTLAQPQTGPRQRRLQWLATIGVDLIAFALLYMLEAGSSFNYAALLVLPVLMSGVLTARLLALGTAAAVALLFLLGAGRAAFGGADGPALMVQSGLAGLGMFAIVLLAGELAGRLAREELAARGSLELARQQAQLNRLVIEEMADGVLVVDRGLRVRAANPAARALLVAQGLGPRAPFGIDERIEWAALSAAVRNALAEGEWPDAGSDVTLAFEEGHQRTLRMRVRFMRTASLRAREGAEAAAGDDAADSASEPFAVVLLEDLRTLQARIRQEKLAAMGRVSAGIAHEIRNPLAAISQANALLQEELQSEGQRRLAQMVADNAERLKRLVDDVMELSPGGPQIPVQVDASRLVADVLADWAQTSGVALGPDSQLRFELPVQALAVDFDAEHLRRVLVNLLDNAHRHAGGTAGSIFLRLALRDEHRAVLSVLSEGLIIAPEVERLLFEPFFSTRSRGSGLGLYICRELCERHGASIDYRPRPAAERLRNEFVVSLRRAGADAASWRTDTSVRTAVRPSLNPSSQPIADTES